MHGAPESLLRATAFLVHRVDCEQIPGSLLYASVRRSFVAIFSTLQSFSPPSLQGSSKGTVMNINISREVPLKTPCRLQKGNSAAATSNQMVMDL